MQVRWKAVVFVGGLLLIGHAGGDAAWAQASQAMDYYSVSPCRLHDTRLPGQGPALTSDIPRWVTVGGSCGIPPCSGAIAINITAVAATGAGNLSLAPYPWGEIVSFGAGQTRSNNLLFQRDCNNRYPIFPTVAGGGTVHVVIDVTGYFSNANFLPATALTDATTPRR